MRLWRPLAVSASAVRRPTARLHHGAAREPLTILFCGSDDFSIASLRALDHARRHVPGLIASIHVVHRPPKPAGRGLKTLRDVPIQHVATQELDLPTHVIDTFTGWSPPVSVSLVVAVSFGLFVPPRILHLAKYGGLNVHPSLLPDLRGPAPVEHAILTRRQRTGVSIQTLHPRHFDRGTVLAQTPAPGIPIPPNTTASALEAELALVGAHMLVDLLQSGKYMAPHKDEAWYAASNLPVAHAPKTTKQDRQIRFEHTTLDHVLAVQRALGDPWCMLSNGHRLLLHAIAPSDHSTTTITRMPPEHPGLWIRHGARCLFLRATCGRVGLVTSSTYPGGKRGRGNAKVLNMLSHTITSPHGSHHDPDHLAWQRVDEH
ncbi:Methionyl-tRNA formyltransferase [Pleosporales sp. CAS-2024a]